MNTARPATIKSRRLLVVALLTVCAAISITSVAASAAEAPRLTAYDTRPLSFEPVDSTTPSVYVARAHGTSVMISPTDVVLRLSAPLRREGAAWIPARRAALQQRLRLVLAGAVAGRTTALDRLRGQAYYFTGPDPSRWRTGVPMWGKVQFHEVYPGIDVVYYGAQGHLEFDFVVAPGADPSRIQLDLEALDSGDDIDVVPGGGVRVVFPTGEVRLRPPHAYQDIDGMPRVVEAEYVLERKVDHPPRVSLRLGQYDATRPLIIDPVLAYSTSFGISTDDAGLGIAVDTSGNTYVAGVADAMAIDPSHAHDAFLMKLDSTGAIAYTVYFGGTGDDWATSIAVDSSGNAYVAGGTTSTDMPTPGGAQTTNHGGTPLGSDAFVAKFGPTGTLLYATYLGGSGDDGAYGIAVGSTGLVYVAGATKSTDFPVTAGARSYGGGDDAFIAKIDPGVPGSAGIGYATYLGGAGDDIAYGIAVDAAGNAHVTGVTASSNFPVQIAFQSTLKGTTDAFVAKLGIDGTLLWSTYFGGGGADAGNGIAVDSAGSAYVTGSTESTDLPLKATTFGTYGTNGDAFVAKFNPTVTVGSRALQYSTYLGGSGRDVGRAIAVDSEGNGYVVGFTESTDFPKSNEVMGPQGGGDAFVAKLNLKTGGASALMYSTYLGGTLEDDAYGIALDAKGTAYVTGRTLSSNFPVAGPSASGFTGAGDGFVARLVEPDLVVSFTNPAYGDAPGTIQVTDTTKNQGAGPAPTSTTKFFLSTDGVLSVDDQPVGARVVPELASGADDTATTTLTLSTPLATGTYTLIAVADGDSVVAESKEQNNRASHSLKIGPDLAVTSLSKGIPGPTLTVTDQTTNQGASPAPASTTFFYIGLAATRRSDDIPIGTRSIPPLAGKESSKVSTTFTLTLPASVTGDYYLLAEANGDKTVTEADSTTAPDGTKANGTNNVLSTPISLRPDLVVSAVTISATTPGGAGQPVTLTETTLNQGATPAISTITRYFLSTDAVFDTNDTLLGERTVPPLNPGQSDTATVTLTIPANVATGSYSIIAVADATSVVTEILENNNTRPKTLAVGPDLRIVSLVVPGTTTPGATISLKDITKNTGGGAAGPSTTKFYLSRDPTLSSDDIFLGGRAVPGLDPGAATATVTTSVTIPASTPPGAWFFIAQADGDNAVVETNETNNTLALATTLVGPDLSISSLSAPATAGAGGSITIGDTTLNTGLGPAPSSTTRFYLSTSATFSTSAIALGSRVVPGLNGNGGGDTGTTTVTIPANTANGSYFILAVADADGLIPDGNRTNNATTRSIAIGPDMTVLSLSAPPRTGTGVTINVSDITSNLGPGNAPASETWYYLSPSGTLADAIKLGSRSIAALNGNTGSQVTLQLMIPTSTPTGSYFLIAKADGADAIVEVDETNNMASVPITVGGDLTVAALTVPVAAAPGAVISISDTTSNVGAGAVPASTTRYYLSRQKTLDGTEIAIGARTVPALGGVKISTATTSLTIPAGTAAGPWFLLAQADADGVVTEVSEANNVLARAIAIGPDLTVTTVTGPTNAAGGATITVGDTTKNVGQGTAPASQTRFYLSTDNILDAGDTFLGARSVPALASGALSTGSISVIVPTGIGGAFFIIAQSDGGGTVAEFAETNNTRSRGISIGPDLVVSLLTAPTYTGAGVTIAVSENTRNSGVVPAGASTTKYYLSTNPTVDSADIFLGSRPVPALNSGVTSSIVINLTIPDVPSGTYFILAQADGDNAVAEFQEDNNVRTRAISIGPDLTVTFTGSVQGAAGGTISITDTVNNIGGGTAVASRSLYYLSHAPALAPGDPVIGFRDVPLLAPGAVSTGIGTATIPPDTPAGQYYVIVKADGDGVVDELIENNNIAVHSVRIGPDLVVSSMTAPLSAVPGASITVAETVKNLTVADAGGFVNWYYLSPDGLIGPSAVLIGQRVVPPIAAGGLSTGSAIAVIPADTVPGNYFIVVRADGPNDVAEYNEDNNTRSKAITVNP